MNSYQEFIQSIKDSRPNVWFKYSERHHIIPRCLGGTDDEDNLIYLTYQEHFIAHKLLLKENPNESSLVYAIFRMCDGKREVTEEEYAAIKLKVSRCMSEDFRGEGNPFYGNHHTYQSKRIMSEKKKLSYLGEGNPFYGKQHSLETKKRMRDTHSNQRWFNNGSEETLVFDDMKYKELLDLGWILGRLSENFEGSKNPFYGKKHTEESRKKISENHADFSGENHPMYGKRHSEETREKMRNRRFHLLCKSCGVSFIGTSGNQKYCDKCSNRHQ